MLKYLIQNQSQLNNQLKTLILEKSTNYYRQKSYDDFKENSPFILIDSFCYWLSTINFVILLGAEVK